MHKLTMATALSLWVAGNGSAAAAASPQTAAQSAWSTPPEAIALPGGPPVGIDYLAYDPLTRRVWVPAGNTGSVDVVEAATGHLTQIGGFATRPATAAGRPPMGPSSAAVGDGVVWIGNRGDRRLCAFDRASLAKRQCLQLSAMPDGLAYVNRTKELWVTTPGEHAIAITDEKGLHPTALAVPGLPEGYAVDQRRGIYYTNLEDRDRTLAIDAASHKVTATWSPGCGAAGPRGLAIDEERNFLFVACTDAVVTLDLAHDGRIVARLATCAGVDNLDYRPESSSLYVASGKAASFTVAHVSTTGALETSATFRTMEGARNPVVDVSGKIFLPDEKGGRLLVFTPPAAP